MLKKKFKMSMAVDFPEVTLLLGFDRCLNNESSIADNVGSF